MASAAEQLAASINWNAFGKATELKNRIWFTLGALIIYRIGTYIPLPGIDPEALRQSFQSASGGVLGLFNMFSGGAVERMAIFALNIMPYISASIIIQLLTSVVPSLETLKKEGESGRQGAISTPLILAVLVMAIGVVYFIVFMERAQRRLLINYPKRQVGNRMFEGQTSFLPLKLNTSGVIPPIFASSLLLLPTTIASFSATQGSTGILSTIAAFVGHGRPAYMIMY